MEQRGTAERDQPRAAEPEPPAERDGQLCDARPVRDQRRIRGLQLPDKLARTAVAATRERCREWGRGGNPFRDACKRCHAAKTRCAYKGWAHASRTRRSRVAYNGMLALVEMAAQRLRTLGPQLPAQLLVVADHLVG